MKYLTVLKTELLKMPPKTQQHANAVRRISDYMELMNVDEELLRNEDSPIVDFIEYAHAHLTKEEVEQEFEKYQKEKE
ncbi:MAG: hypothetical protein WC390_09165 [Sulfurimonas sp.]